MNELRNPLRFLYASTILLFLVVAVLALVGYLSQKAAIDANRKSRIVQCLQRHRLEVQIRRTSRILDATKGHVQVFGFPRALLVQSLHDQQSDRRALSILDCPPEEFQ